MTISFFWDIIFQAERIYFIDEFFYTRKKHEDSLTASGDIRHINIIGVVNGILKLFIKHNQLNNYKDKLYNLKITWIMDRYNEIQEEYKEKFFRELKNDFEKFKNTEFKDLLTDNNKFIFYNVLTSNNHDDFDLMSRLYDRKIKETSRQRNELEECINIINENSIEIDRLNDELDKKNKVKNFLLKLKNRNHRSEKMHKSSYNKMKKFKEDYLNPKKRLKILDIGSYDKNGDFNYGLILNEKKWKYHGLDLKAGNNVDIVVDDPYDWKEIKNKTYDVVVSGQAFEHMEYFWLTLEQVDRVLKPGGLFCLIVPSSGPVHKNPYDCYRFNADGLRSMAKYVNFEVLKVGTDYEAPMWKDSYLVARKPYGENLEKIRNKKNKLKKKIKSKM